MGLRVAPCRRRCWARGRPLGGTCGWGPSSLATAQSNVAPVPPGALSTSGSNRGSISTDSISWRSRCRRSDHKLPGLAAWDVNGLDDGTLHVQRVAEGLPAAELPPCPGRIRRGCGSHRPGAGRRICPPAWGRRRYAHACTAGPYRAPRPLPDTAGRWVRS